MRPRSRWTVPAACTVVVIGMALPACGDSAGAPVVPDELPAPRTMVVETAPLSIDRIYPSMTGPFHRVTVDTSELDWITAVRTEVVDEADGQDMGGEFFCHSQLEIHGGVRLAVNATGGEDIRLPPGFGLPVSRFFTGPNAGKDLTFFGMVLNNHFPDIDRDARIRANIEYLTDDDVGDPPWIKKLYYVDATIAVEDLEEYVPTGDVAPSEDVTTHCVLVNDKKVHWMVPPGEQLTRRTLKGIVPVPSRVHFAQAHMHNHGRYVKLTDMTTGDVLWQADVVYEPSDRVQIQAIPPYSSTEGFPLHPHHEYELEALYDNTTDHDTDAMAVMYMYFNPDGNQDLQMQSRARRGGL